MNLFCHLSFLKNLTLAIAVTTEVEGAVMSILLCVYAKMFTCMQIDRSCGTSQHFKKGEGFIETISKKVKFIERERLNTLRLLRKIFLKQIYNPLIGLVFLSAKRITRYMYLNAYWDMLASKRGDEEKRRCWGNLELL